MNENLCDKLSQLNELAKRQRSLKSDIDLTKEQYINKKIKKPEMKDVKPLVEPSLDSYKRLIPTIIFAVAAIGGIALLIMMGLEGLGALFGVAGFVCAVLTFVFAKEYISEKRSENNKIAIYAGELKEYKAATNYNETEYPKLLEKYNSDCAKLEEEFLSFKEKASCELKEVNEKISAIDIEYPPKAYFLLDRVVVILKERRADDLESAVRLAKREYDKEKAMDEEIMRELDGYIKQLDEVQEKMDREREEMHAEEERRRRNRHRCYNCANHTKCNYLVQAETDNCGAYIPKNRSLLT